MSAFRFGAFIPFQVKQRKVIWGSLDRGKKLWVGDQEKYGKHLFFSKFCRIDLCGVFSINKSCQEQSSSWLGGRETPFINFLCKDNFPLQRKTCALFLELFLSLLVLDGLQLKIIHMPTRQTTFWGGIFQYSSQSLFIFIYL